MQATAEEVGRAIGRALTSFKPADLDFSKVSSDVKTLNTNLKNIGPTLNGVTKQAKTTSDKIKKEFNFDDTLSRNLETGFKTGLSHAIGAVSIGADPIRALRGELTRNLAISIFNTLYSSFKQSGDAAKGAKEGFDTAAEGLKNVSGAAIRAKDSVVNLTQQTSAIGTILKSIDFGAAALSAGLIFLGSILDKIGDKLIDFSENLANKAGEANLSFSQLNAVLSATGESIGANLGPTDEWLQFITELSVQSGKSRKELSDFAISFVQVGAEAGLGGKQLQELLRIAAFTGDRFRTSAEQLNNFRNALVGNFRPINTNIFIANDAADATAKYSEALQRQGLSQEEATERAKSATIAETALFLLQEKAAPTIDIITKSTGSYTIELKKLTGAFENLQISLGSGIEPIFAKATKTIRTFVEGLSALPQGIQNTISVFIALNGAALNVSAVILKIAGVVGLVGVALTTLNAVLTKTSVGMTLAGNATNLLTKFVGGPIKPLTNLSSIFNAFLPLVKNFFASLLSGRTLFSLITQGFASLNAILAGRGGLLGVFTALVPAITVVLAKLGILVVIGSAIVDGFRKVNETFHRFNDTGSAAQGILELLNAVTGTAAESFTELAAAMGISDRASALYTITTNLVAKSITGLAYAAGLAALSFFEYSAAQNKARAEQARLSGNTELQQRFLNKASEQEQSIGRINRALDGLEKSYNKLNIESAKANEVLTANSETLANLKREAIDTAGAIEFLGSKIAQNFNKEQISILENAIKSLQSELDSLKVKNIELISGKAAAEQAKNLLKLKEVVKNINKETGGVKLFGGDDVRIDAITSAKQIFDEITKVDPAKAKELEKLFNQTGPLSATNEKLTEQKSIYESLLGSVQNLKKSLQGEILALEDQVKLQKELNTFLAGADFSTNVKELQQQNEISKATLDIERKIQAVREQLSQPQKIGNKLVPLDPKARKTLEAELDNLTVEREAKIRLVTDLTAAKELEDKLKDIDQVIRSTQQTSAGDFLKLTNELKLLDTFNDNISKGVKFAETQVAIKEQELALEKRLNDLKLLKATSPESAQAALDAEIKSLQANKGLLLEINGITKRRAEIEKEVGTALQANADALNDQLHLIEERRKLFQEGILRGEFNNTKEQIDALTGSLESLLKERIRLQREQDQLGNKLISDPTIKNTEAAIDKIKEALRAANFVEGIREVLQTIPDAINDVLEDGIRGVIQGTQKISDLFRNMASNIFLSISRIFAKKTFDLIGQKLDSLAETIATSDIGKSIASAFGIDVDKLNLKGLFGKAQGPQEQLKEAVQGNTDIIQDGLIPTIKKLITALGGKPPSAQTSPPSPTGTQPPSETVNRLPPDGVRVEEDITSSAPAPVTSPLPPGVSIIEEDGGLEIFDEFNQDFSTGVQQATQTVSQTTTSFTQNIGQKISDIFHNIGDIFSFGLESLKNIDFGGIFKNITEIFDNGLKLLNTFSFNGFNNLFKSLGSLIQTGLNLLNSLLNNNSGGNDGLGIGLTVLKGIGSLFGAFAGGGAAKGGMIPGTPSTKDNRLLPVASGEYVNNAESVSYYGKEIFDALNSMALPKDFFSTLDSASAPSRFAGITEQVTSIRPQRQSQPQPTIVQAPPVSVVVEQHGHMIDPKKVGLQEEDVVRVYVNGMKKDGVIRKVSDQNTRLSRG